MAAEVITRQVLKRRLDAFEIVLIEALPAEEYARAHLPGAINIPLDRAKELAGALLPDKFAHIVTYGSHGGSPNSQMLAAGLFVMGYPNIWRYQAGKRDWLEAGLPVQHGTGEALLYVPDVSQPDGPPA